MNGNAPFSAAGRPDRRHGAAGSVKASGEVPEGYVAALSLYGLLPRPAVTLIVPGYNVAEARA